MCKRLVDLMGGVIRVTSTVGAGSTFSVELNLTAPPAPIAVVGAADPHPVRHVAGDAPVRTLLYVEDNPANLMLIEDLIARRPDVRLLSAGDGSSGIEIARTALPDVILMDINLPGVGGIEALRVLSSDPVTAHIPIIALSANAGPRDIARGLDAGFFRYLTKPIKVAEFMATLDEGLTLAESRGVGVS